MDWRSSGRTLGSYLDIPRSKRSEIKIMYQHNEERLRAMLSHWVHTHPCPSWGDVVMALHRVYGGEAAAEDVREKYLKGSIQ